MLLELCGIPAYCYNEDGAQNYGAPTFCVQRLCCVWKLFNLLGSRMGAPCNVTQALE